MHIAPSHASRLLQAAHMIVYLHYRMSARQDRDERAVRANQAIWDRVVPKIHMVHCWWP